MSFLHPWAIAVGLAAAALPVAIHFLTRPSPVRLPLSTLRFVRQAIEQRRARHRLRDFLILLLRTAAILLIALAIARPRWGQRPVVTDEATGDTVRVVVLDVSQSMAASPGGIELIERGRSLAGEYLGYRPQLAANLILAAANAESSLEQPSTNFQLLRDELSAARVRPERLNVKTVLERAAEMLTPTSEQDQRRRELVIVSDFQRLNWGPADFSVLPPDTQIQFTSAGPETSPGNLAILRAGCAGRSTQGRSTKLEVEVGNFSPVERTVAVEAKIGQSGYRLSGACPAGSRTVLSTDVQMNEPGWKAGEARLLDIDDALPADNARPFVVEVRPKPLYALVTRQQPQRRPSSSYYLECALAPDANLGEQASTRITRVNPDSMDLETLAPADLIVLDHPGQLNESGVALLASLMRRGRPLLYVAGETIDATNLRRLQDAAGRGLQMPVEFQPPASGQPRRNLFLTTVARQQQPFDVFGDGVMAVVGKLRFAGGLASRQVDGGLKDDVLATLNDGSAMLVHSLSDAGQLAVLNLDLESSNLHSSYAAVLLLDELVQRLLSGGRQIEPFRCGEMLPAQLPPDACVAANLKIVTDDASMAATDDLGTLADEGSGVLWTWPSPARPGVYRVAQDDRTVYALAVEPPGEESQLDAIAPEVLTERLAAGRNVRYRTASAADHDSTDDVWAMILTVCVVCLLGELALLRIFRS